ncbi:MAG: hypothetical protein JJE46_11835, partial [Acidimicrobiia bacterium]|nr:hypothetical protein [Acidimicrobiia bacterium]
TPNFVRALGSIAHQHATDLARAGATIDAAMLAPDPPTSDECDTVDALLDAIEAEWPTRGHPEDLVPSGRAPGTRSGR